MGYDEEDNMKRLTFKKGIHPKYHKDETASRPIQQLLPRGDLVFPMSQHIGKPCNPIVKKGQHILVGEKIGEAQGFVSASIHSSISGIVKAVEDRMTLRGTKETCVVIENDELYTKGEYITREITSQEDLVSCIREAGLVGMGGATFPTHVKLSITPGKEVNYIIVNAAECEPYLTSDYRVMLEYGEELIQGLLILLGVFEKAIAVIGIEDNKMDAFNKLVHLAEPYEKIRVVALNTKYPQGSEKHLIYSITQREVPRGKLPIDIGCIVQNVDSIIAIYQAVTKGQPIMRRIVTLSGSGIKNPCNLEVKIGTSISELLEYGKWDSEKTVKIIAGGPMMGVALSNIDVPVMKGTSAILCFTKEDMSQDTPTACIRCGKCEEVCPMQLIPNQLHRDAIYYRYGAFKKNYGMDCIECGCCSYICPAKRELVQSIRTAKAAIRNM